MRPWRLVVEQELGTRRQARRATRGHEDELPSGRFGSGCGPALRRVGNDNDRFVLSTTRCAAGLHAEAFCISALEHWTAPRSIGHDLRRLPRPPLLQDLLMLLHVCSLLDQLSCFCNPQLPVAARPRGPVPSRSALSARSGLPICDLCSDAGCHPFPPPMPRCRSASPKVQHISFRSREPFTRRRICPSSQPRVRPQAADPALHLIELCGHAVDLMRAVTRLHHEINSLVRKITVGNVAVREDAAFTSADP